VADLYSTIRSPTGKYAVGTALSWLAYPAIFVGPILRILVDLCGVARVVPIVLGGLLHSTIRSVLRESVHQIGNVALCRSSHSPKRSRQFQFAVSLGRPPRGNTRTRRRDRCCRLLRLHRLKVCTQMNSRPLREFGFND